MSEKSLIEVSADEIMVGLEKAVEMFRARPPSNQPAFMCRIDFIRWQRFMGKSDDWINEQLKVAECEPIGPEDI